jgi:Na+/proline symporter
MLTALLILGGYTALVWIVTLLTTKASRNKETFLAADRNISMFTGALSIAGSWVWAPALFIAAQKAYEQGITGVFWFLLMNVLCLVIFAPFAKKMRDKMPKGFTLSEYMRGRYGKRVHTMYMIQLLGLSTASIAVQLLAGGMVVALITGLPFLLVTIILSAIAFSYTFASGLKASISSDWLEMGLIFLVMGILVPMVVVRAGGIGVIADGLGGLSGNFRNLLSENGKMVFLTFGLSTSIGLLSGPFGDQTYWQRAFSIKKDKVAKAFVLGAFLFALVPLTLSLLGFVAAGIGFQTADPSTVNLQIIEHFLPAWTLIPFAFMLLGGLIGTIDSQINSVTALLNDYNTGRTIGKTRLYMLLVLIIAVVIANIPGIQILYLFMLYGTLRASTFLLTVISLLTDKEVSEKGVFWGILLAIAIGLPVFAYGNLNGITPMIWGGSLLTIFLSGGITILITLIENSKWKLSLKS